jgi:hypothetical protein
MPAPGGVLDADVGAEAGPQTGQDRDGVLGVVVEDPRSEGVPRAVGQLPITATDPSAPGASGRVRSAFLSRTIVRSAAERASSALAGVPRFRAAASSSTKGRSNRPSRNLAVSTRRTAASSGASVGLADCDRGQATADQLLSEADAAVYQAKAAGRGCVMVASLV